MDLLNNFKVFDTAKRPLAQEPTELTRIRVVESIIWFSALFSAPTSSQKLLPPHKVFPSKLYQIM